MFPDLVNALFEVFATIISVLSVRRILLDKEVKGVSPWPWMFFVIWGFWNLFFYSNLNQWFSTIAGLGMLIVNLIWLFLYRRYTK